MLSLGCIRGVVDVMFAIRYEEVAVVKQLPQVFKCSVFRRMENLTVVM